MPIEDVSGRYPDWPPIISIRISGDVTVPEVAAWVEDNAAGHRLRVEVASDAVSIEDLEAAVGHGAEFVDVAEPNGMA